ncbi:heparinase II/III family protein [Aquincola sp. S2]|uniref:Heparinase II/III family protein n=1 Tax=Pseudaquabacterium terrae TaxID=2732868 RepID=A0ABX2EC61_9BURK|nr:heparinase II/III family protein [Aquabacterium terrae]NRF66518.1 heparinase II/III family protein [Aquabacterium terrae]
MSGSSRWRIAAAVLPLLLVLAIVWVPEWLHWYVPAPSISDAALQTARTEPADAVLAEIAAMPLSAARTEEDEQRIPLRALEVLNGRITLPGYPSTEISRPLAPRDLSAGPPTLQLMQASLAAPDMLLDAYRLSRDERFFAQARDDIVAFARFESSQWLNTGFLWNDHAIAARIPVLVKFWRIYRTRTDFDPAVGRQVLALAERSGRLLTRDSHYAYRTGHGILSDLGAMQVSLAFPVLDPQGAMRGHGQQRFARHLAYYVSAEGPTLLHSAGYHSSGLEFFGIALRLYSLANTPIPEDWWQRYDKSVDHYGKLRRPDGTLPLYGDTRSVSEGAGPPLTARGARNEAQPLRPRLDWPAPRRSVDLYPLSGHALWWDGAAEAATSQTAITWSYFPGLGHKLADDLSLVTWSNGRPWITNVGYWPWGFWGRPQATSWPGSNAPHRVGEPAVSKRESKLVAAASAAGVSFVDMQRDGPDGLQVRRQVLRLAERDLWLVLDATRGATGATATHWTFAPDLLAGRQDERRFRLVARGGERALTLSIDGPDSLRTEVLRGSREPFGGWVVDDREPVAAPTIAVRQSAASAWALAGFALSAADAPTPPTARMLKWTDAEHWTMAVDAASGRSELTRDGLRLTLGNGTALALAATPSQAPARQAVLSALAEAERGYPRFAERVHFRFRWTRWIVAAWVVQELLAFAVRRWRPRWVTPLRIFSIAAWIAAGVWLGFVYFEGMWW